MRARINVNLPDVMQPSQVGVHCAVHAANGVTQRNLITPTEGKQIARQRDWDDAMVRVNRGEAFRLPRFGSSQSHYNSRGFTSHVLDTIITNNNMLINPQVCTSTLDDTRLATLGGIIVHKPGHFFALKKLPGANVWLNLDSLRKHWAHPARPTRITNNEVRTLASAPGRQYFTIQGGFAMEAYKGTPLAGNQRLFSGAEILTSASAAREDRISQFTTTYDSLGRAVGSSISKSSGVTGDTDRRSMYQKNLEAALQESRKMYEKKQEFMKQEEADLRKALHESKKADEMKQADERKLAQEFEKKREQVSKDATRFHQDMDTLSQPTPPEDKTTLLRSFISVGANILSYIMGSTSGAMGAVVSTIKEAVKAGSSPLVLQSLVGFIPGPAVTIRCQHTNRTFRAHIKEIGSIVLDRPLPFDISVGASVSLTESARLAFAEDTVALLLDSCDPKISKAIVEAWREHATIYGEAIDSLSSMDEIPNVDNVGAIKAVVLADRVGGDTTSSMIAPDIDAENTDTTNPDLTSEPPAKLARYDDGTSHHPGQMLSEEEQLQEKGYVNCNYLHLACKEKFTCIARLNQHTCPHAVKLLSKKDLENESFTAEKWTLVKKEIFLRRVRQDNRDSTDILSSQLRTCRKTKGNYGKYARMVNIAVNSAIELIKGDKLHLSPFGTI